MPAPAALPSGYVRHGNPEPGIAVESLRAARSTLYNSRDGITPVREFVAARRAVRVGCNSACSCAGIPPGVAAPEGSLAVAGVLIGSGAPCAQGVDRGLPNAAVRGFTSVIVAIDRARVRSVVYGQRAARVASVGSR